MRIILYEGLILAVLGTVLGILLGFGFAFGAKAGLQSILEGLMGRPLGEPKFEFLTYVISIAFGLGVPLASVLLPARGASDITPLEAMRPATVSQEAALKRSRLIIGLISLVLGLAGLFSGVFQFMAVGVMIFLLALGLLGPMLISPDHIHLQPGAEPGLWAGRGHRGWQYRSPATPGFDYSILADGRL